MPRSVLPWLVSALAVCFTGAPVAQDRPAPDVRSKEEPMQVHYLEIVTPDVEATCGALAELHGVTFSEPRAELGNARTAALDGGGLIGVRAPMHADEEAVVRPYLLVDDIESAVEAAEAAGGQVAVAPTEIAERGRFAIFFLGGIQHGLWQL
jgi:predicted enzyme related to lactoylglutathione lyase